MITKDFRIREIPYEPSVKRQLEPEYEASILRINILNLIYLYREGKSIVKLLDGLETFILEDKLPK